MSRLKIGVIGLGMAAAPHLKALADLRDTVDVVGAFARDAVRREAACRAAGLVPFAQVEALLDASEAVIVLTPPNTHLELVEAAAARGTPVLLEKPLDISWTRACRIAAIAETLPVGVVFQNRFRPALLAARRLIAEGTLGRIISASASVSMWRPQSYYDEPGRGTRARDGGGVLLTQAIHTLDLLQVLAGAPAVIRGFAGTSPLHRMETEDVVAAAFLYLSGATGTFSATTCAYPGFDERIDIVATGGTLRLEGAGMTAHLHDRPPQIVDAGPAGGAGTGPMGFGHAAHRALIADFVDALRQGRPVSPGAREALDVHATIAAILDDGRLPAIPVT